MTKPTYAIILAAGKSTRMRSDLPKVLHPVCGQPMLSYALAACRAASVERMFLVVGHQKDRVIATFPDHDIEWVEQTEQLGTGHAVQMCVPAMAGFTGDVLVLAGDMPLVGGQVLAQLLDTHRSSNASVTLATTELTDPTGYGRIVRNDAGELVGIVEQGDCTTAQRAIREVNPSYYCFDGPSLFTALGLIEPNPVKGEYYITDAVHILVKAGKSTATMPGLSPSAAMGVNSPEDLARIEQIMQDRDSQEAPFQA